MNSNVIETLQQERAAGLPCLAGSRLSARVPLREPVLNAMLRRAIGGRGTLESVHVRVLPANRLQLAARVRVFGFHKTVKLEFHLQPLIDGSTGWEGMLAFAERSVVSKLLSTLAPRSGALPPGVMLTDDGVIARLPPLLSRAGAGEILPHLARIMFETEEGTLWVSADVRLTDAGPPSSSTAAAGSANGSRSIPTLEELQAAFHGAIADLQVRIAAPLANALVAAGLDDAVALSPSGAERPKTNVLAQVRPWIEHHLVSFEEGVMVFDAVIRVPEPARETEEVSSLENAAEGTE